MVHLSLTEAGISKAITGYRVHLSEVMEATKSFIENLQKRARQANYPALTTFTNEIVRVINDDLPSFAMKDFEKMWNEEAGGNTLMNQLDRNKNFDRRGIEQLRTRAQVEIEDAFRRKYDYLPETTENMNISTTTFKDVQAVMSTYRAALETKLDHAIKFANDDKGIEKTLLQPSLYVVISTMQEQLQQYLSYSTLSEEEFKKMMSSQMDRTQQANKKAKSKAVKFQASFNPVTFLD